MSVSYTHLDVYKRQATLFGLKDFLTLYASGGYTRSWSEGLNYSHMYDEFYYLSLIHIYNR